MGNCLEVKQVSKAIGENAILENVSFTLEQGKIYGMTGKNGSGKTMLFRIIGGLVKHDTGSVCFNGTELIFGKRIPYSVGLIIEHAEMYPEFTGLDNLRFLASIHNKISEDKIREAIERVGLNPEDKRTVKNYSLGMKQRIIIAQAIMEKPQVLLLDEPTNALDVKGIDIVRQIILEEKQRGAIILLASHNIQDTNILCDEIYEFSEGKVEKKR